MALSTQRTWQWTHGKLWKIVKDREAWTAIVCGVAKSWTQLSNWTATKDIHCQTSFHILAIFLSSLVRYLFNSLALFYWVACFLVVEFLESFTYLDASSLLDMCFTNIFSDFSFHSLSDVFCRRHWVFATPETIQSMEFSRPEYWSRFPSAGDAPNPEMEPRSSVFQVDSLPAESPGKPIEDIKSVNFTEVPVTTFFFHR